MIRTSKDRTSSRFRNRRSEWVHFRFLGLVVAGLVGTTTGFSQLSPNGLQDPVATCDLRAFPGPDGRVLPLRTDEEVEDFLLTAEVVDMEDLHIGVARARRAYLEKDGIKARACFRDIDVRKRQEVLPHRGIRIDWRDCCLFECAAYELAKLLGLHNIPPVVRRKIKSTEGTLQLWVEQALMESDRARQKIAAPDLWRFKMQWQVKDVFDALVHNDDRNGGNFLYDQDWNLWLIDHTRCFPLISDLPKTIRIKYCERSLWKKLQNLDEGLVEERLSPYLESEELKALFKRKEKLIRYIEEQIEQRGEDQVLCTF